MAPPSLALLAVLIITGYIVRVADAFAPTRTLQLLPPTPSSSGPTRLYETTRKGATEPGLFPLVGRDILEKEKYDLIVVGSGNGACGFLSHYLEKHCNADKAILVLERGQNYFFTSDITHQNKWTESYAMGHIFKLHNTYSKDGKPILSGGASTHGGGGSINYTMIHESSTWLAKHLGFKKEYWDKLKHQLNAKFKRKNPLNDETPITSHIIEKCKECDFADPVACSRIENIPNQNDDSPKQLYQFPTQFNTFGQRTNSGVSILDWENDSLRLETGALVESMEFDGNRCTSINVRFSDTKEDKNIGLKTDGKVILCAGAATPRLLLDTPKFNDNTEIGKHVSDHIAMPLGIYVKPKDISLSPKDIYGPVFATLRYPKDGTVDERVVVSIDFFTGKLEKLLYLTSHLFLAFLLPNYVKGCIWKRPWLFEVVKTVVRWVVSLLNGIIWLVTFGKELDFITAIIKYNPSQTGEYDKTSDNRITLDWFEDNQDSEVAKTVIQDEVLDLLNKLGTQPIWPIRFLYRLATKVPYKPDQVNKYINNYKANSMLSEQHLAGGCLLGHALETGENVAGETGKVKGSENVHVADLSAVPLPRVSPQMTAYLIGHHVASRLYGE